MFVIFLGWFLIFTGVVFLLSPQRARRKIVRSVSRKLRWVILAGIAYAGAGLWSVAWGNVGLTPKITAGAGMVVMIWLFWALNRQASVRLAEWMERVPGILLRLAALAQVIIGVTMIIWRRQVP